MSCVVGRTREVLGFGIQEAKQKPKRRELEAGRQVDDLAKVGPPVGVTLPNGVATAFPGEWKPRSQKNPSWREWHEWHEWNEWHE